jgi:hypothetical protein
MLGTLTLESYLHFQSVIAKMPIKGREAVLAMAP